MTKDELKRKLADMGPGDLRGVVENVVSCIYEGRAMMDSSDILEGICETLKDVGLDDGEKWEPEEFGEAEDREA